MLDRNNKILIVGLGLIGGSYAQGLTKSGYEVGAITKSQSTLDYAFAKGIISHGYTDVTEEYVSKFDIIVFALYPHLLVEWVSMYRDFFKDGSIITDVTGVKSKVVYKVQGILGQNSYSCGTQDTRSANQKSIEFVGAHPMAGKELSGIENADSNVFIGANYIITPTSANSERGLQVCEDIGRILGFANISRLSPEEHDEMIGFLSQLTHCIAVSLMNCNDSHHLVEFTGDSFRDLTRIANINEKMWPELFVLNKESLLGHIDRFIGQLNVLRTAIETEDIDKIESMMRISTQRRKYFDK